MRFLARCALALALAVSPVASVSQTLDSGIVQSPVLVIEFERVFAQSAFGQRIIAEIEAQGAEIAAENRQIEAELQDEEQQLTEQRASMETQAFRALAVAFDDKVQKLREEQDAKARELTTKREEAQRLFLSEMRPVLEVIMRDAGAAAILDRRAVFLSNNAIDISDTVIERMDVAIGDGAPEGPTDP